MRKSTLYVLLGVAGAALVITLIVILGSSGSKTTTPAATASLPPGHPQIAASTDPNAQAAQVAQVDAMIKTLEKQSAAKPGDVKLQMELASAYMMGSKIDKAAAVYGSILKTDPSYTEAKVQLAIVWQGQGHSAKALAALQDIIKADANNQSAHYALGMVYYGSKQSDKAKTEWQTTVKIDPTSTNAKYAQTFLDLMATSTGTPTAH